MSELHLPTIETAIASLRRALDQYPCHIDHFIADTVLYGLAVDVIEHGIAVVLLAPSEVPRAAFANARAAFEASIDLLYLTESAATYDRRGCLARVHEVHEDDRLRALLTDVDKSLMCSAAVLPDVNAIIAQDADAWDGKAPGRGDLLRNAAAEFASWNGSKRKHWSGMTRRDLAVDVAAHLDDDPFLGKFFTAIYAAVSGYSHPRARTGQRNTTEEEDGGIAVTAKESDKTLPGVLAAYACVATEIALQRRRGFAGT